ncbi:MAG TPA: DUF1587 domain-containing protein, partial [Pirellulales bacterium]|nr:DUF1587 domain-containing protein [Pirellulales bacterium]
MRRPVSPFLLLVVSIGAAATGPAAAADLRGVLSQSCLECHDDAGREAGLSLESLGDTITAENASTWSRVLLQVERRNMPPGDKPPLADDVRRQVVAELEDRLADHARANPEAAATVLRRLNRSEYRNSIRDLLKLNVAAFDPTREFPDDNRVQGFASNGEKLVTSSYLLRQYLEAAEQCVERAVRFEPRPETKHWDLVPPFDRTTKGFLNGEARYFKDVLKQAPPYQSLYERMRDLPKGGYHPLDDFRDGMPASGWYTI